METNKSYKNTYHGLNQDLAKSKYDNKIYFDGQNIRLISHTEQTTGVVSNIRGTEVVRQIPTPILFAVNGDGTFTYRYNLAVDDQAPDYRFYRTPFDFTSSGPLGPQIIIGYANLRSKIILFCEAQNDTVFGENTMGFLWEFDPETYDIELKYMHRLQFSSQYPIEAVGNYENEFVQKVYWTDNFNELRHLNIADPQLPSVPLDFVNVVPNVDFVDMQLTEIYHGRGSFTSGTVRYAYSYINQYGAETKISPVTPHFNVTDRAQGSLVNDNVSISFGMTIPNIRADFDLVRIYRLKYDLREADPVITLIKEEPVSSTSLTFVDDGTEVVSAISLPQFQLMGTDPFVTYTLASKDNRLFTANNRYKFFNVDFDCRAFRFDDTRNALIFKSTETIGVDPGTVVTSANWGNIDADHDCINPSTKAETDVNNAITLSTEPEDAFFNQYIYQENGATIGAEGPNVRIGIVETPIAAQTTKPSESPNVTFPLPQQSFLYQPNVVKMGFKRDEIYRLGVVFFNNRGQQSFVNWVCDFRMPHVLMPGGNTFPLIDNVSKEFNQLQLSFQFKASAVTQLAALGVTSFRVVRVERGFEHRTIQAQGMLGSLVEGTDPANGVTTQPPPYMATYGYNAHVESGNVLLNDWRQYPATWQVGSNKAAVLEKGFDYRYYTGNYVEFRSPDLNLNVQPTGYFVVHGAAVVTGNGVVQKDDVGNPTSADDFIWAEGIDTNTSRTDHAAFSNEITTDGIVRIDPWLQANYLLYDRNETSAAVINDGVNSPLTTRNSHALVIGIPYFYHSICNYGLFTKIAHNAGDQIWDQLGTILFTNGSTDIRHILLADFKRRLANQYGGDTYADRTRNKYIDSSETFQLTAAPYTVYGDTYVTNMRYQRSQYWTTTFTGDGATGCVRDTYFIPCEMTINDDLRDNQYTFISTGTGLGRKDRYFTTNDQFHQYNPIFDYIDPYTIIRATKPFDVQIPTVFDTETKYSDLKIQGELYDSWVSFAAGNVNNVDGDSGPIERLLVNKDIMFYFQHYGYGVWNINPNVQVVGEDGTSLELGTGSVLHEYQYISTNGGCQHKWSISKSPYGMVWYDQLNRKVSMVEGQKSGEANIIGLNTFLQNLPDIGNNPLLANGVNAGYYKRTNETYISFINTNKGVVKTWIFSDLSRKFVSSITLNPPIWIQGNTGMFIPSGSRIEQFDTGRMGVFNDRYYPSYVTIMLNGDADVVKILTNLLWNSEYYDENGNEIYNKTITHVRVYNDYQDTGLVALNDNNSERLLREWRFQVPMIGEQALDRLRSQYHFVQLYFDDNENSKLVLHDMISTTILQT